MLAETVVKKSSTTPWKPVRPLDAVTRAGHRRRWTRLDMIEKRLLEGWILVQGKGADISPKYTLMDGTQLTNIVQKRNLVLMEIPEETALEIEAYYQKQGDYNLDSAVQDTKDKIVNPYGKVEISRK